jgi:hypothetical protein
MVIIAVMLAYPSGLAGLLRAAWSQGARRVSKRARA